VVLEAVRDGLEHGVADGVAVLVVDLLEVVDVEQRERRRAIGTRGLALHRRRGRN